MDEDEEFDDATRVDPTLEPPRPPMASTLVDVPDADSFDAQTRVDPVGLDDDPTRHDFDPAALGGPGALERSSAAARTIVQAMPGPAASTTKTHRRPLPDDDESFDAPTRALRLDDRPPPPAAPPIGTEIAPPGRPAAEPQIPPAAVVGALLVGLLFCAAGLGAWLVLDDSDRAPQRPVVETPAEPAAPERDGPQALDVAPPLPEAAGLAIAGRFDEAARAYAAIAREHPERPELATMAHVLHAKGRGR